MTATQTMYACTECGRDCSEDESVKDFAQFQESEHCRDCNEKIFNELQSELSGMIRLGH